MCYTHFGHLYPVPNMHFFFSLTISMILVSTVIGEKNAEYEKNTLFTRLRKYLWKLTWGQITGTVHFKIKNCPNNECFLESRRVPELLDAKKSMIGVKLQNLERKEKALNFFLQKITKIVGMRGRLYLEY